MKMITNCFFIIILFISICSPVSAREKLKLCSADSPPWTVKIGDGPSDIGGLAVDIMEELARRGDFDLELVALPFKRCLQYTQHGVLDGCFMTIKNEERESYAAFTDSYLSIPTYTYYDPARLDRFEWEDWEDLKAYKIGSQRGFRYGQEFTDAKRKVPLDIVEIKSVKAGLEMLRKGRVDLILSNEYRFRYLVKKDQEYKNKFMRAQKPVAIGQVYIAISRQSPNVSIVPRLNGVLDKMTSDGTIQRIVGQ